ncbi:MAG: CBS domain-containing protein [Gemmatimonadales bacterium]
MTAVHEMMSTSPVTVGPATSVGDLLALFDRHDFNAFPVLDEHNRLLGIVSKLDLLELFLADDASTGAATGGVGTTRVEDLMHHEIVSVEARDPLSAAGALMLATKLRSLPVVERQDDRLMLVGILSRGDILRGLRFQLVEGSYVRQVPES